MDDKVCQYCKKKLVPIGKARKKGKRTHNDWDTRKYHKKCFIKIKEIEKIDDKFSNNINDYVDFLT